MRGLAPPQQDRAEFDPATNSFENEFLSDETIKPWLYGNWWRRTRRLENGRWMEAGDEDLQLIGIGLRLGPGPEVKQGEGNNEKSVDFRGTAVRVRTLPGG